jgi:hypothetical protein
MKARSLSRLFVFFILIFIAVIVVIIHTALSSEEAPQPDPAPDIGVEPPPNYGTRVAASCLTGLVMVAGIAVLNRLWGPFLRFETNLWPKRTPLKRQQRKRSRLGTRLGILLALAFVFIIVTVSARTDRFPVSPGAILFGLILAAAGLATAASLVSIYLVLHVLRPYNQQQLAQKATPDDEQDAELPPELEPLAQQLAERGYTRLGVIRAEGCGSAAFMRVWIYSGQDAGLTAMLYFDPLARHPVLLLASMFEDGALLETHYRTAIRIERPDYVAQSVSGDFDDMFTAHRERLAAFGEAHGTPLAVRSLEDYFALRARIARPHADEFARACTRAWLGLPLISLIMDVGVLVIALLLYFPSPGMESLSCLFSIGSMLLALAVMYTYQTVKGVVITRPPQTDRESEGPVGG